MSAPINRTQRMLQFIAKSKKPVTHAKLVAIAEPDRPYSEVSASVSAQLCGLVTDGKLKRTGKPRAFLYSATATTLVDRRTIKKPSPGRASRAKAKPQPKPEPARKPAQSTAPVAPPPLAPPKRSAFVNLGNKAKRPAGERETVAEFLARGGRIQKLAHGASSQPAYVDVRAVDQRSMRQRLQKAIDTDPANTTDDDAVAA